jgi:uncharacterized membrane protein
MEAIDLIKVHPPVVHFAIALPVALLVIDLYYRFKRSSQMDCTPSSPT